MDFKSDFAVYRYVEMEVEKFYFFDAVRKFDILVLGIKKCKNCGRVLPVEKFRRVNGQFHNPYYLGHCKECEYKYQRGYLEEKNKIEFSDGLEILIGRQNKETKPERILDISKISIIPLGTDEIFAIVNDG